MCIGQVVCLIMPIKLLNHLDIDLYRHGRLIGLHIEIKDWSISVVTTFPILFYLIVSFFIHLEHVSNSLTGFLLLLKHFYTYFYSYELLWTKLTFLISPFSFLSRFKLGNSNLCKWKQNTCASGLWMFAPNKTSLLLLYILLTISLQVHIFPLHKTYSD